MREALYLYKPFFRWAKRKGIIRRSPLADFDLPTSNYIPKRRVPPETEQVSILLNGAVEHTPDIAPILTLDAVTGMRRGEAVVVRRTNVYRRRQLLFIDKAADVKGTKVVKNHQIREVALADVTIAMIDRVEEGLVERAAACGIELPDDAFLFSLEIDGSAPMPPDYLTKRLAVLKDHLGIPDKRPETVALEDQALQLYRKGQPAPRAPGQPGPKPKGAMSFAEIGRRLNRSDKWASNAVKAAQRREQAALNNDIEWFDGSLLGVRRYTTTELLDAGFDISTVTDRHGHSPNVSRKHYSRLRLSADRRATDHLARIAHTHPPPSGEGLSGV